VISGDYKKLRQWLTTLEPLPAHQASTPPSVENIYAPASHEAALDLDRTLVIGSRGVGKSFWAGALLDSKTRSIVANRYPKLGLDKCNATLGFAEGDAKLDGPPSADVLNDLLVKDKFKAETVWRAVVLHSLRSYIEIELPNTWRGKKGLVAWVDADAERVQRFMHQAESFLQKEGKKHVVVFDALDRLGATWAEIRVLCKALLKVALALRTYKTIKLKIFMRIDQAEDPSIQDFPDASKIVGAKVDLTWARRDLFGLLFTLLANHKPVDRIFKKLVKDELGIVLDKTTQRGLIQDLMIDEAKQERIFSLLAGQYMGSDKRRGRTYLWVHNHLSDAFGQVSPRTFLVALRAAAENGDGLTTKLIEPKGIHIGVQVASARRVEQLQEEFGWIRDALEPLADLQVPCEDKALFDRWKDAKTIAAIETSAKDGSTLVPLEFATSAGSSAKSLLNAMRRLGVAEKRPDGRTNIPDIYRVAAKLLRKGGVKPAR
jgi:hypothetical protein